MNSKTALVVSILAMAVIIVVSNKLVETQVNDWLTWGTLTYPFAFLVTDLMNRYFGAKKARLLVYAGFVVGVLASLYFADPRIAMASGSAFLVAQLLDVSIFDVLRSKAWWIAPFASSVVSTVVDTFLFYGLAFYGTELTIWPQLAVGDLGVKWAVALAALIPYAVLTARAPRANVEKPG